MRVGRSRAGFLSCQELQLHSLAILALDSVVSFDLGIACEVFGHVRTAGDEPGYQVQVCAAARKVRSRAFTMNVRHGLGHVAATARSAARPRMRR